jgi:hypothetical protein
MSLPITNVVDISISSPQSGLGAYNINNVAILDRETPLSGWSGTTTGYGVYANTGEVLTDWGSGSEAYAQAVAIFEQRPNILSGGGALIIYALGSGQTLTQGIQALQPLIFFGGVHWAGYSPTNSEIEAAVATCQALNILCFCASYQTTDLTSPGLFYTLSASNQSSARMFLYTLGSTYAAARAAMAAAIGRGMSTDFTGSNTTISMQMKDLAGVLPDPNITETIYNTCQTLGVDVFTSVQGLSKYWSNGGPNGYFFDAVYNLEWLVFALQVALFNVIAETSTKIPQTERGIAMLRNAAIGVLKQGVINGYLAPGTWTATDTFGDPVTFENNILQNGYYVYTAPLSQQSAPARLARQAPLMQIAVKSAGAVHSTSAVLYINP